jgi:RNA polymerase sigma-70 factor (ECF subfamily)
MEDANGRGGLRELEIMITEFQDQLFRFAFFRTGSYSDGQDIVQEVFIKLYRDNKNLNAIRNIRYYLFRSVANACIDYQRKNRKTKFVTLEMEKVRQITDERDAAHQMLLAEEYQRIEDKLSTLPFEQAETIRMRVLDDLSFTDIAEIQDIPVTTVKSRFKYGIDKLKSKVVRLKEVNYGL